MSATWRLPHRGRGSEASEAQLDSEASKASETSESPKAHRALLRQGIHAGMMSHSSVG
jgi:hypothetical protein